MPEKKDTHELRVEKLFSVKDYVCVVTGGRLSSHTIDAPSLY